MIAKSRKIIFNKAFREDLRWWFRKDKSKAEKILDLIESATEDPFKGLGKPEPLKHIASGVWSRRITQEHRLVYRVTDRFIEFLQARYHY
ncbi:Txe/YoeB family addiction module toxin [Pleurocapsa sp. PCC 7319]|uniref:Txe/YoeB family addiction module toxin n=1 Tax=Pleurocapsa sp. PCC 7319 TaxID=118161 RepID=UPI0003788C1E|nr:Txe/YoeB family addiction module toxin [Pleurocapsa sp. PCC 7319]